MSVIENIEKKMLKLLCIKIAYRRTYPSRDCTPCLKKKHVTTSSTIRWLSVYNNFRHTYYREDRPLTHVFPTSPISCTYFTLGTVKTKIISVKKLNKITKISHEDVILINLYPWKQYGARRLLNELPDTGWQLGSIDSLLKRICKMGTIVQQPGSGRPRSSRSSGGPCAQSGGRAK